jgi:DNA topoisomerase-3
MTFMAAISDYVRKAVNENKTVPEDKKALLSSYSSSGGYENGDVIGSCPRCNNDIAETQRAFSCVNRGCKYALWKDSKFFTAKKKKLTKAVATALLTEGRIFMSGLHSPKTGKSYSATIILVDDNPDDYPKYDMEFEKKQG